MLEGSTFWENLCQKIEQSFSGRIRDLKAYKEKVCSTVVLLLLGLRMNFNKLPLSISSNQPITKQNGLPTKYILTPIVKINN